MRIKLAWRNRIDSIRREGGLVDGCKYMVYFKGDGHSIHGTSYPVKDMAELEEVMKDYGEEF